MHTSLKSALLSWRHGAMANRLRPCAQRVSGVLLAAVMTCSPVDLAMAAAAEPPAVATPLVARTQFVLATTEAIEAPYPTPQNLPRTLSKRSPYAIRG